MSAYVEHQIIHIRDIVGDREYRFSKDHQGKEEMDRTILAMPILREEKIIGLLARVDEVIE